MIKFSKLTDYAVVTLATLSHSDEMLSASALSAASRLPEPTVSKVLKLLAKADVVNSVRGVNGGYKLARTPQNITVAQIVSAIEGPVALTSCVDTAHDACDYSSCCPVKGRWDSVNLAIKDALSGVSLADMIRDDYKLPNFEKTQTQGMFQ